MGEREEKEPKPINFEPQNRRQRVKFGAENLGIIILLVLVSLLNRKSFRLLRSLLLSPLPSSNFLITEYTPTHTNTSFTHS